MLEQLKTDRIAQLMLVGVLAASCFACFTLSGVAYMIVTRYASPQPRVVKHVQVAQELPAPRQEELPAAPEEPDTSEPTPTPAPTNTPEPTPTPAPPTFTPEPTFTPLPTPTSTLVPTPTPRFRAQTQQIGPIYDSLRENSYSIEVTLQNVEWLEQEDYKKPKPGNIYLIAYVKIRNLGPSSVSSIGPFDFEVLDANGTLRDYELIGSAMDTCFLELVDLMANGTSEGCISYEVPKSGSLSLIFAPYQYGGLEEGRYLSLPIR